MSAVGDMHECEVCGLACDCDGDDLWSTPPEDCACDHDGSGLDENGDLALDTWSESGSSS